MAAPIEDWLAENYDALVADEVRGLSYTDIAEIADEKNDPSLAAWARSRAAGKGKNVTPVEAVADPPKAKRDK